MPISGIGTSRKLQAGSGVGLDQGLHHPSYATSVAVGRSRRGRSSASSDQSMTGILDRADALDLAADAVARLQEDRRVAEDADAGRRARSR